MTQSRIRSTGPLGTVVVLVFLLALISSPLRACFSHHGHHHGAPALAQAVEELAEHAGHLGHSGSQSSDEQDPQGPHEGCDCLGACQLENASPLPNGFALALVVEPALWHQGTPPAEIEPTQRAPRSVRLARGPPSLA